MDSGYFLQMESDPKCRLFSEWRGGGGGGGGDQGGKGGRKSMGGRLDN